MIRRPLLWAFAGTILGETAAYLFPGWWSYLAAGAFAAALAALCLYAAGFSTDKNQYLPRSGFSPRIVHVLLPVCFGLGVLLMTRALVPDGLRSIAESVYPADFSGAAEGIAGDIRLTASGAFRVTLNDVSFVRSTSPREAAQWGMAAAGAGHLSRDVIGGSAGADGDDRITEGGGLLVYIYDDVPPEPGDRVVIWGTFHAFRPASDPGQFDARSYYRALGIDAYTDSDDAQMRICGSGLRPLEALLYRLRSRLSGAVRSLADVRPGDDDWAVSCGIIEGLLLGEKSQIDADARGLFGAGGIAHLLAFSGLHITLSGSWLFAFFKKKCLWPYPAAAAASGLAVFMYCGLWGWTAASLRGFLMFSALTWAEASARPYDSASAMSAAGLIICLISPLQITQAGFVFSFSAVWGMSVLAPVMKKYLRPEGGGVLPYDDLIRGLAMQISLLPAVTRYYYRVPAAGLFLNLLAVPLMPYVVCASFAAMCLSLVSPALGAAVFLPAHILLCLLQKICALAASVPGLYTAGGCPSAARVLLYLGLVAAAYVFMKRAGSRKRRARPARKTGRLRPRFLVCIGLYVLGLLILRHVPSGDLEVYMLDVGQGQGIFIEFPSGAAVFIDGGSSDMSDPAKDRLEPFLDHMGVTRLDMVFITHIDSDHTNGITDIIAESPPREVCLSSMFSTQKAEEKRALAEWLRAQGSEVRLLSEGDRWTDASGASLTVVYPASDDAPAEDENDASLVMLLEFGDFGMLITGDIGGEQDGRLIESLAGIMDPSSDIDVLQVAHHGSKYATTEELLSFLQPRWALISYGYGNMYGHPAPELIERLEDAGAGIYRTALDGCLIVRTDGCGHTSLYTYL